MFGLLGAGLICQRSLDINIEPRILVDLAVGVVGHPYLQEDKDL